MKRLLIFRPWLKFSLILAFLTICCDTDDSWGRNPLFPSPLFPAGGADPYTFEAGVYVITQNALDEAPYRYGNFLQQILRRMEKQKMPQVIQ